MAERSWTLELSRGKLFNCPEPHFPRLQNGTHPHCLGNGGSRHVNEKVCPKCVALDKLLLLSFTRLEWFVTGFPLRHHRDLPFVLLSLICLDLLLKPDEACQVSWGGHHAKMLVLGIYPVFSFSDLLWQESCRQPLIRARRIGGYLKLFSQ